MARKYYFASYAKHHKNLALCEMAAEFYSAIIHQFHPIEFIKQCNKLPGDQRYVLISWQEISTDLGREAYKNQSDRMKKFIEE